MFKSEKEKDSLQQIEILKDHQNKLILDSIINKHTWISRITPTISFTKWDIVVIHGNQKYIMKYVKKGYFLSLENKADWKGVISLMSWAMAPHRKENKDNYDILPLLSISLNNENYQNFLAYSFYEVITNFKQKGHEKGNKLTLSVPEFQYKDFKKIREKCIELGIDKERIIIELNQDKKGVFYKYIKV